MFVSFGSYELAKAHEKISSRGKILAEMKQCSKQNLHNLFIYNLYEVLNKCVSFRKHFLHFCIQLHLGNGNEKPWPLVECSPFTTSSAHSCQSRRLQLFLMRFLTMRKGQEDTLLNFTLSHYVFKSDLLLSSQAKKKKKKNFLSSYLDKGSPPPPSFSLLNIINLQTWKTEMFVITASNGSSKSGKDVNRKKKTPLGSHFISP